MSSPPPAGSRRRAAPAGSASAERQPLRAGGQPPAPAAHLEAVDRGRVTASALVGGDGMAPELLVHGHASGLISLFPLSAAMLPAAPMHGAGARVRPQSAAGGIDGGTPSGTPPAGEPKAQWWKRFYRRGSLPPHFSTVPVMLPASSNKGGEA